MSRRFESILTDYIQPHWAKTMDIHGLTTFLPLLGLTAGWRGVRIGGKTLGMGGGLGTPTNPLVKAFDKAKEDGDRAAMERIAKQMNEARLKQKEAKASSGLSNRTAKGDYKPDGFVETVKPLDIKVNAPKTGAVKAWKSNPRSQSAALDAAHWYARREKTDAFIFNRSSSMAIETGLQGSAFAESWSSVLGRDNASGQQWAPAIRVTPSGDVSQVRVYID